MYVILLCSSFFSPPIPSTAVAQTYTCQKAVHIPGQEEEGVGMRKVGDGKVLGDVIGRTLEES